MISQTAEYALRAVVFLAQHSDRSFPSREIATATKVPPGYMSKVLQQLARADIVKSQRGVRGGFALARSPRDLTMLDVLAATDTPVRRITKCPLELSKHVKLCALHQRLDDAMAYIERLFGGTSIAQFIDESDGIVPLCADKSELVEVSVSHAPHQMP